MGCEVAVCCVLCLVVMTGHSVTKSLCFTCVERKGEQEEGREQMSSTHSHE